MFIKKYLYFLLKIFADTRQKPADPRLGSTVLEENVPSFEKISLFHPIVV